jgi:drug/metabolite transporter (DMT)-like permease
MLNAALLTGVILLASYSNIIIKIRAVRHGGGLTNSSIASYFLTMAMDPWVWTSAIAVALAAALWLQVLRRVELSIAQPIMALTFVLAPLAAALFLNESLPPLRLGGIGLILLGVIFVARTA